MILGALNQGFTVYEKDPKYGIPHAYMIGNENSLSLKRDTVGWDLTGEGGGGIISIIFKSPSYDFLKSFFIDLLHYFHHHHRAQNQLISNF